MTKIIDFPKLRRDLSAVPVDHEGEQFIGLIDPQKMSLETLFLPAPLLYLASFFDGFHSLVDIQAEYMRRYGEMLFKENLEELIEQLDCHCLLEGGRYQEVLEEETRAFSQDPVRRLSQAGLSYPEEPQELRETLDQYFTVEGGPGRWNGEAVDTGLRGVIAPHIGLSRGGAVYAWAYKEIAQAGPADVYFLLGTAHFSQGAYFTATTKDFETPWGTVGTDKDFLASLIKNYSGDLLTEELLHRQEHSLEFQVLFLHYLFPDKPFKIIPLLCGSLHQAIFEDKSPKTIPQISDFLAAVEETIKKEGKRVVFIAAADLAHMGQRFGDEVELTQEFLESEVEEDQALLQIIETGDAEGFFNLISGQRDRRKICGLSCIYTMLNLLAPAGGAPLRGRFLSYGISPEPETNSMVSFAGLAYY